MNRIYNVIWSKAKHCYVVVSELVTSGGGKTKSVNTGKTAATVSAVMGMAVVLAGLNIGTAEAANDYRALTFNNIDASGYVKGTVAASDGSYLYNYKNPGNMAPFDNSNLYNNGADSGNYTLNKFSGIAIGNNTNIQEGAGSNFYSGLAIGNYAQATGGIAFALGHYAQALSPSAMAIGTATKASGFNSLAMMRQSAATGEFSTALGTASWANGSGSFAMGYSATAKADQSIAIGAAEPIRLAGNLNGTPSAEYNANGNTVTEGTRSLAFGTKARTALGADDSMAFGSSSKTGGANAVAMGFSADAQALNSFAIGNTAVSSAESAVAMGKSANASGESSFAMGSSSKSSGANAISMGSSAQATKSNSIALGGNSKSEGADALAIGGAASASKDGAIALGKDSKANNTNTTAIGLGATVTGSNSMAIGTNAKAESNNSLALGAGTEVKGQLVNAYSAFTNKQNNNVANGVVAVGNAGAERRIVNVAGGENDTDAVNVEQLKFVNKNLAQSLAGPGYTGYEPNGSTYKAPDFNIKNKTYHTVKEALEAAQTNFFSTKGVEADANYNNEGATGTNATAAGVRTTAAGNFGTAIGADAAAAQLNTVAIGHNAKGNVAGGVALGSDSVATVAAGTAGYNVGTANNRANAYSGLTGAALTSTMGAVSIGAGGNQTRQITNLAAGTADTDAVNVAQLRNVNLKIAGNTNANNNKNDVLLDNQTLTVKGDGTYVTTNANGQTIDVTLTNDIKNKIDNAADKNLSNITNAAKQNITALGTVVQAGNNITIGTPVADPVTGQKTYTVNGMDTKVSLGTSGLMTLTGGNPDASGVRSYVVDVDPAKVAKTDLSNITNDGKSVIREEAQKAVKVIAGNNTTITEGTDGTYKTYKVDVDAPDYRLVANPAGGDYTVTNNKVDLTVEDAKNPANKTTVTIKDIASKTELDGVKDRSVKYDGATGKDTVTLEGANGTKIKNLTDGDVSANSKEAVNGGQLHKATQDLTNTITNTKNDLINTGLKFNADNNSVQTNKLGSTVTVAGDNTNISTEISKTGEDTTIKVKLGQDISVNSVTAVNTVKAGTAVMGAQTLQNSKGTGETGSFVSGLGNTSWSITDPSYVSGRAATEDQLKTVSDAIKAANDSASDYRLIANPETGSNGEYTVTSNKVDLKVKDEKSGTTNTVTIKDIASKTELDGVKDRSVKYDGATGKDIVTLEGANGTKIKNLADGEVSANSKEAVNGGQLHKATQDLTNTITDTKNDLINMGLKFDANEGGEKTNKLGSTVKVQGEGAGADSDYSGENIKTFITQDGATGNTTIDIKMNKNLKADSLAINGKNGKDAVSLSAKDGVGHIGLAGKNGTSADIFVEKGDADVNGTEITRIKYIDENGKTQQVATKDDGLQFTGNNESTVNKQKLNALVKVQGEGVSAADSASFASASGNINVKANGTDTLEIQLAKDLKNLNTITVANTVTAGTAVMGKQTLTNAKGTSETGNYVAGLDNTIWDSGNIVSGRAATEDQLKAALAGQSDTGLKFDANEGGAKTNKLGSTVTVRGEGTAADSDYSGENIKTFITQDPASGNTTIDIKMNKNLKADSLAINGKNGKDAVSLSSKDGEGHIGLAGKDGRSADIFVEKGDADLGGTEITRIKYKDEKGNTHQVATKDDGMAYGGDSGDVIKKKLNEQLNIKGGVQDEDALTENNIGVISKDNVLNVRLAKDLKGLSSITFNNGANGNTVVNGGGMTINDGAGNPLTSVTKDGVKITDGPSMTTDGIDAADKKITNVADGKIETGSKDAVNGGQLADEIKAITDKGFGLTADDGQSVKKSLGETVTVNGDGTNIKTSVENGNVKVALEKNISVETLTANTVTTGNTSMDTNGITVKDGANDAVKLTKDGLQINDGADKAVTVNKDGLTIENGPKVTKDGIDGGNNKITGVADGDIDETSKDAVNGGQLHKAVNDIKSAGFGLKAEDGNSVKKSLGEVIDLKGDGNIKTSVDGDAIKLSLGDSITVGSDPDKQVKIDGSTGAITTGTGDNQVKIDGSTGSVTAGNSVKAGDVLVGKQTSGGQNGNFVTGLDNTSWDPENPTAVAGRAATEDQLKAVNDDFNNRAKSGRVFQGDQSGDAGKVVRGLGDTMNLTGGADVNRLSENNIAVIKNPAGDGYNIKLAKDINMGDGSTSYNKTVTGANPYTVDTKVDGGGLTITPSVNGQAVPGRTVSVTENGLNNGNNTITGVAPGVNGTDAVNVNQLNSTMRSIDGKIADVGASSAAIAGLKPLQYDPLEPTQVLASVGHYKGSTAAAIGLAHYTNESTLFHMGVSLGGHDNMVNAGVSYKFGTSDAKKAVPERYKGGPISSTYVLQDEVTALKAENARMQQKIDELSSVKEDNEQMKAQIALLMQQVGLAK